MLAICWLASQLDGNGCFHNLADANRRRDRRDKRVKLDRLVIIHGLKILCCAARLRRTQKQKDSVLRVVVNSKRPAAGFLVACSKLSKVAGAVKIRYVDLFIFDRANVERLYTGDDNVCRPAVV